MKNVRLLAKNNLKKTVQQAICTEFMRTLTENEAKQTAGNATVCERSFV